MVLLLILMLDFVCLFVLFMFSVTQFEEFVQHQKMQPIADRTVWVHVSVPGQEPEASDLPSGLVVPVTY